MPATKFGAYGQYGHVIGYACPSFLGLPRGRSVDSILRYFAAGATQSASPMGQPQFTQRRTASSSAAACSRLTLLQPVRRSRQRPRRKDRKRRIVALVRDGGWTKASTRHASRGFARRAFRST